MILDAEKMLNRCNKHQWDVNDFDWTQTPERNLSKEDEMRFCQYYIDMSYIERIAGDLFQSLSKRLDDPTLVAIYETFCVDELRHSHAALKLMDYFDVHHYKIYTPNPSMIKAIPHFSRIVDSMNPAWANSMMLGGELFLDIALLRGINDYVDDPMGRAVMEKINQDESRHLAMDFYMTEYCSTHNMKTNSTLKWDRHHPMFGLLRHGPAFFNDVFLRPMVFVDPSQKHLRTVMKRLRRINSKDEVKNNPAVRQFNMMADFFETPMGGRVGTAFEKISSSITGIDLSFVYSASLKNLERGHNEWKEMESAMDMADKVVAHG